MSISTIIAIGALVGWDAHVFKKVVHEQPTFKESLIHVTMTFILVAVLIEVSGWHLFHDH